MTALDVSIKPDQHVFRGETVTIRCDIDGEGVTSWQYSWYKDSSVSVFSELQEHTFSPVTESDAGKYSCYGAERGGSRSSQNSDAFRLTVSDRAQAVLSVSPQKWLTEGDPVTLICEVYGSSTGWTFSWFSANASSVADWPSGAPRVFSWTAVQCGTAHCSRRGTFSTMESSRLSGSAFRDDTGKQI
ncbi:leukocyte immunoglobulin-like receptor subfamily A member 4 [Sinocyclocheilus rhinocerous]|uniref:leukocyte immunoglobulin-like receptor subfamily A member 4 n=1 Tax=Sinocyclocheilus rhinocerous TaxID=307959 RepID=UPI0007BACE38|nr:PREDICTED: leukocyte immunoglobulin-like receptor subfamily A member 4 [Sinocyclocheilus rhinocerous]